MLADEKAGLVGTLDLHAVSAYVAHAGFRIFGYDIGRSKKWAGVLAHGPDWDRQLGDIDVLAVENIFFARPPFDHARRNRVAEGMIPFAVDPFDRVGLQADGINLSGRSKHPSDHGTRIALDVFE